MDITQIQLYLERVVRLFGTRYSASEARADGAAPAQQPPSATFSSPPRPDVPKSAKTPTSQKRHGRAGITLSASQKAANAKARTLNQWLCDSWQALRPSIISL